MCSRVVLWKGGEFAVFRVGEVASVWGLVGFAFLGSAAGGWARGER